MKFSIGGKKSIWFTIVDSLSAETLECSHTIGVPGGGHHVLSVGCRVGVQMGGHARAHAGEVVAGVPGGAHAVAEAWQPGVRWVMSICCWLRFLKWSYFKRCFEGSVFNRILTLQASVLYLVGCGWRRCLPGWWGRLTRRLEEAGAGHVRGCSGHVGQHWFRAGGWRIERGGRQERSRVWRLRYVRARRSWVSWTRRGWSSNTSEPGVTWLLHPAAARTEKNDL